MMGNSPRDGCHYPVDFNAQQAMNALYLSAIGDVLNDKDTSFKYKRAYFALKTRISQMMWDDETGFYYDLDRQREAVSRCVPSVRSGRCWPRFPTRRRASASSPT